VITSFTGEYRFLSNFSLHPVELPWLGGIVFPTAEHAYQASKASTMPDVTRIMSCATPGEAKRMGRTLKLSPDWEQVKRRAMIEILLAKFGPSEDLSKRLADTEGALVEGNTWGDIYWGAVAMDRGTIPPEMPVWAPEPPETRYLAGQNWLGKCLMMVRELVS
jgi:ribA/ribD-fused uncharacterized protein